MELSVIEKYFFEKLNALEKENAELKEQLKEKTSDENICVNQTIGKYYSLYTHSWYVKENNYKDYERALEEKDFEWLNKNEYEISVYLWNYVITICGQKFYFYVYGGSKGNLSLNIVEPKGNNCFETLEQAQEQLLKELEKDINNIKTKVLTKEK